jgi:hypothetical protein
MNCCNCGYTYGGDWCGTTCPRCTWVNPLEIQWGDRNDTIQDLRDQNYQQLVEDSENGDPVAQQRLTEIHGWD